MDILYNFISEELIYALGWTVMHSLWQGFLIAIIMIFVFQALRKKSAQLRYEVATFSLFMVLISAICTFIWYYDTSAIPIHTFEGEETFIATINIATEATALQSFAQSCIEYFNVHLPMIVLIWLIGVSFFILRLFGGLIYIQRLKYHRINPLSDYWQDKVSILAKKIPTSKIPEIVESASIKVPMVIGYFKPFILLPVGAINQLGEEEVEAIIAHELAHIFRNDFLINIFLSFIEVLFYYHPAVWWISGNIRLERENCCDDIAIKVCGNSLTYAKALVRLQDLDAYAPGFAMPFSGQKNQLLNRVKRILNQPQNKSDIMEKLAATGFLFLTIIFMSVSASRVEPPTALVAEEFEVLDGTVLMGDDISMDIEIMELPLEETWVDSLSEEHRVLRGKELKLLRKDGAIEKIMLDGRVIPKEEYEQYDHIETENGIRVYDDEVDLRGDIIVYDTFPKRDLVIPNNNKASRFFYQNKSEQKVTKMKNEEGQTLIIVEAAGQEPVEIVLEGDGTNDVVIVEGNMLEDGDTAIIIDENRNRFPFEFNNEGKNFAIIADSFGWDDHVVNHRYFFEDGKSAAELLEQVRALKEEQQFKREIELEKFQELQAKLREQEFSLMEENKRYEQQLKKQQLKNSLQQLGQERGKLAEIYRLQTLESSMAGRQSNVLASKIANELERDGLIEDVENFSFLLTKKRLKINGKKQSKAFFKKYAKLYEKISGKKLGAKSKYQITYSNK